MVCFKLDPDLDALKRGPSASATQLGFPGQRRVGHTPCWRCALGFLLSSLPLRTLPLRPCVAPYVRVSWLSCAGLEKAAAAPGTCVVAVSSFV